MNPEAAAKSLRQLIEGRDFTPPEKLMKVSAENACKVPAAAPYSIATNVWHCDFWNRIWLARLLGEKRPSNNAPKDDWYEPKPEEWEETRKSFLDHLNRALEIAEKSPFEHAMKDDETAVKTLTQIAVHSAYHVGQIVLLKRIIRLED